MDVLPHPRAACYSGAMPFAAADNLLAAGQGSMRTVIFVVCGDHLLVIQAAQSSVLCASRWRYFATPTGRYHRRTSIRQNPLRRHPCDKVLARAQVRDPRESTAACCTQAWRSASLLVMYISNSFTCSVASSFVSIDPVHRDHSRGALRYSYSVQFF